MEEHADYDGPSITWGLDYKLASAAQCCQACKDVRGTHNAAVCGGGLVLAGWGVAVPQPGGLSSRTASGHSHPNACRLPPPSPCLCLAAAEEAERGRQPVQCLGQWWYPPWLPLPHACQLTCMQPQPSTHSCPSRSATNPAGVVRQPHRPVLEP